MCLDLFLYRDMSVLFHFVQMTSQDDVVLVVGSWGRDDVGHWVFESDIGIGDDYIQLTTYMTFEQLVKKVREQLCFRANDISVKLSYQYPE